MTCAVGLDFSCHGGHVVLATAKSHQETTLEPCSWPTAPPLVDGQVRPHPAIVRPQRLMKSQRDPVVHVHARSSSDRAVGSCSPVTVGAWVPKLEGLASSFLCGRVAFLSTKHSAHTKSKVTSNAAIL